MRVGESQCSLTYRHPLARLPRAERRLLCSNGRFCPPDQPGTHRPRQLDFRNLGMEGSHWGHISTFDNWHTFFNSLRRVPLTGFERNHLVLVKKLPVFHCHLVELALNIQASVLRTRQPTSTMATNLRVCNSTGHDVKPLAKNRCTVNWVRHGKPMR